jgi:L-arabinose isomerase
MIDLRQFEVWFATGSQHLYGPEMLRHVEENSVRIVEGIAACSKIPVRIVKKPVLTDPEAIRRLALEANSSETCAGLILWMHTFSPAKMWIAGLGLLARPTVHLHTQFNRDLPWSTIDMNFMNLNQSAHGDREFGHMQARLRSKRKVVVGFWQDPEVVRELAEWARAASAWRDAQGLKVARFGDNMRQVAVTEGDKVAAQMGLGYSVNGYGITELADAVRRTPDRDVDELVAVYESAYHVAEPLRPGGTQRSSVREAARIELGLRTFLDKGGFKAFTDTFEDLDGLAQLPGIGAQRLMADGYGFGAEGDWKTAALVRALKVMAAGMDGGTSFMEDYTYDFGTGKVLGAHMLEVCPTIAENKPSLEVHPLSIGGKADPVRLVFDSRPGPAVVASVVDVGSRFRMIVNEIDVVRPDEPLPKLPVARAVWNPRPNLRVAAKAWILAGGAHHTAFSNVLNSGHLKDFADMAGMEYVQIDEHTEVDAFERELRWNAVYYHLNAGA